MFSPRSLRQRPHAWLLARLGSHLVHGELLIKQISRGGGAGWGEGEEVPSPGCWFGSMEVSPGQFWAGLVGGGSFRARERSCSQALGVCCA